MQHDTNETSALDGLATDSESTCYLKPKQRLLSARYEDRAAAPKTVWNHRDYGSWRADAWRLIDDFATPDVVRAFLANPPEYVVDDDLSWLDEIVFRVNGDHIDSKSVLAERLYGRYHAIRAVHATRTDNVDQFYAEGLKPLQPEAFHDRARSIFLSGQFPELNETKLLSAIQGVGVDLRKGRVFFEANEEMLLSHWGHYALYGSEYLIAIAAHLDSQRDYRQVLTRHGTPTIFVCDIPLDLISDGTLEEFAGDALALLFIELLDGESFKRDPYTGAGFCIHAPLKPSNIVGHYHPVRVRDPFHHLMYR